MQIRGGIIEAYPNGQTFFLRIGEGLQSGHDVGSLQGFHGIAQEQNFTAFAQKIMKNFQNIGVHEGLATGDAK